MWIGPTHRCQQKRSAMCSSRHVPLIESCNGVISPLVFISLIAWEPSNPFWQVKIVTPKESIGSRVRASPGRAFASSLKSMELRAPREGTPCNIEQCCKSDERIRARTKEANPPRPNHQNKQAHPNSPPKETETELAHTRLKCEKKVTIQRSNTEVRRGNEFKILAALSTRCPSSNSFLPHG